MKSICISAMLQSQQVWLPKLRDPIKFINLYKDIPYTQRLIAHCIDEEKRSLSSIIDHGVESTLILIGPEGDFTNEEIVMADKNQFCSVSLGRTRLRSETAAVVAAAVLALH
jgi:16S rRNA (uracil1498-N3)-methyltransferase